MCTLCVLCVSKRIWPEQGTNEQPECAAGSGGGLQCHSHNHGTPWTAYTLESCVSYISSLGSQPQQMCVHAPGVVCPHVLMFVWKELLAACKPWCVSALVQPFSSTCCSRVVWTPWVLQLWMQQMVLCFHKDHDIIGTAPCARWLMLPVKYSSRAGVCSATVPSYVQDVEALVVQLRWQAVLPPGKYIADQRCGWFMCEHKVTCGWASTGHQLPDVGDGR